MLRSLIQVFADNATKEISIEEIILELVSPVITLLISIVGWIVVYINLKQQFREEKRKFITELHVNSVFNMYKTLLPDIFRILQSIKFAFIEDNWNDVPDGIQKAIDTFNGYRPLIKPSIRDKINELISACQMVYRQRDKTRPDELRYLCKLSTDSEENTNQKESEDGTFVEEKSGQSEDIIQILEEKERTIVDEIQDEINTVFTKI